MKRLIVNADDLGRTRGINAGVFEAHRLGIVTSATAMVNYPSVREAAELSERHPGMGIGLHVALTGGITALPAREVPSLVDGQGRQPAKPEGLEGADPAQIAAEVEAQFARFIEVFGRRPTHLDSHHHSHRRRDVFDAIVALALREGLPIRNAGGAMRGALAARGVRANDGFVEEFFDAGVSVPNLIAILRALPEGVTEIMCHPAHPDPELAASSSYAARRAEELAVLCDPRVREAIEAEGIHLVTFAAL